MWTRSVDGKTEGHQVAPGPELDKLSREVANYKQFVAQVDQIVEVNEAICEVRPASPLAGAEPPEGAGGENRGSSRRSKRSSSAPPSWRLPASAPARAPKLPTVAWINPSINPSQEPAQIAS